MEVELVTHTPKPERICAMAAKGDRSGSIPDPESFTRKEVKEILDAVRETGHFGIFEHVSFTFKVEDVSRVLSHQLVRHRLATYDQQSQRVVDADNFDVVKPHSISEDLHADMDFNNFVEQAKELYKDFQERGIDNEDARFVLPNATTTNVTVTMNARMLRTFFEQRCCKRAQWEIRDMAWRMLKQCKQVAPLIFKGAGAPCMSGECPESEQFTCGEPYSDDEILKKFEEVE